MLRRVVVTGLGLVTPVGVGVEAAWKNLLNGENGARRIDGEFEASDLSCQIANFVPRGDDIRRQVQSRRLDGAEGTAQGRRLHHLSRWRRPSRRSRIPASRPTRRRSRKRTGVLIGSGIGGLVGIADTSILLKEKGPRRVSPFFIPGRLINLAAGYVSIQHRPQRAQPRRRHRLLDRRACHRRRRAAGRAGRCRRHGGGRHRKPDLPHRHGRLRRLPRAVDRLQRQPDQGLAALRQGPRRLRDGRGRRRRRARGASSTPRRAAPRSMPRSSATACRATPITSPRRPRRATGPTAACGRR